MIAVFVCTNHESEASVKESWRAVVLIFRAAETGVDDLLPCDCFRRKKIKGRLIKVGFGFSDW